MTEEQSALLKQSVEEKKTGWQLLARYAFYCMVFCGVLAAAAVLLDEKLIAFILKLFDTSAFVKSAGFAMAALVVFVMGYRAGKRMPDRIYSRESFYFLGVLLIAASDWFLGKAVDTGSGHYSLLLLLAFIVYAVSAFVLSSHTIWLFGLVTLCWWFIAETDYQAGDSLLYYGMNVPVRFSLFSVVLLASSYAMLLNPVSRQFFPSTKIAGLLCLFLGLWGVAVFGNYDSWVSWSEVSQYEIWLWNLPLALQCVFWLSGLDQRGMMIFINR